MTCNSCSSSLVLQLPLIHCVPTSPWLTSSTAGSTPLKYPFFGQQGSEREKPQPFLQGGPVPCHVNTSKHLCPHNHESLQGKPTKRDPMPPPFFAFLRTLWFPKSLSLGFKIAPPSSATTLGGHYICPVFIKGIQTFVEGISFLWVPHWSGNKTGILCTSQDSLHR